MPRASRVSRKAVVLVGVMAALVVVAGALAPAPADAATRVVTKMFGNSRQITIPEGGVEGVVRASPYPSKKSVRGLDRGRVLDVNVSLKGFSHGYPDDVDVMLSKGSRSCIVMSDVGGDDDVVTPITLKLDDEAASSLPDNFPQLVGGRFRPTNAVGTDGGDFFYDPPAERIA